MKTYYDPQGLRIVGKAWQVRYKLQMLMKTMKAGTTVNELLARIKIPAYAPAVLASPAVAPQAPAQKKMPEPQLLRPSFMPERPPF